MDTKTAETPDVTAEPIPVAATPVPGSSIPPEELEQLTADIVAALKTVYDPEIPADIYELGLIYKIDVDDERNVAVEMTLTAPGCPVAGEMPAWVENAVASVAGVGQVSVKLTFDPPWDKDRMSDEAKLRPRHVLSAERGVRPLATSVETSCTGRARGLIYDPFKSPAASPPTAGPARTARRCADSRASSPRRPTSWIAIGRPSLWKPHGSVIAGCPVRLKGCV